MLPETEQKIVDRLINAARQLDTALAGLREEQLDLRVAAGEWSIRQIVHHLVDDGDVWCMLIKRAIVQPGTDVVFGIFPGNEAWAAGMDTHRRDMRPAQALIQAHNSYMVEMLCHFADAWECTVVIRDAQGTQAQPFSVGNMADMLGEHMEEHIATIRAIRAAHGL